MKLDTLLTDIETKKKAFDEEGVSPDPEWNAMIEVLEAHQDEDCCRYMDLTDKFKKTYGRNIAITF